MFQTEIENLNHFNKIILENTENTIREIEDLIESYEQKKINLPTEKKSNIAKILCNLGFKYYF